MDVMEIVVQMMLPTIVVMMWMQKCKRGSDGPPALMVQSHVRVSPPRDCNVSTARGINIPY